MRVNSVWEKIDRGSQPTTDHDRKCLEFMSNRVFIYKHLPEKIFYRKTSIRPWQDTPSSAGADRQLRVAPSTVKQSDIGKINILAVGTCNPPHE